MFWTFLFSLFLTTSIEGIIYAASHKWDLRVYVTLLIANLTLNPVMNLIITSMPDYRAYLTALIIGEVGTVLIESLVYYLLTKKFYPVSLLIAFTANIVSFAVGHTINTLNLMTNEKAYIVGSVIFLFITVIELFTFLFLFIRQYHQRNDNGKGDTTTEKNETNSNQEY